MANAGPDTNKAQFFVAYAKAPHLDGKYTIFGRVIDGADDTLDAMERAPVGAKNRPSPEIRLNKVGWSFSAVYAGLTRCTQVTVHANPIADAQLR
jgi:peptidyl-prolyl cis-trans isomerase-like 3